MLDSLSVNEALDQLDQLDGEAVAVHGILCFEFEHIAVWHYPKSERRHEFGQYIWLSTGTGSLQLNQRGLQGLNGHRVLVMGLMRAPDPLLGGCGHLSSAAAEIMVNSIEPL